MGQEEGAVADVVAAVLATRSREVGVAVLDLRRPVLRLNQVADSRSFAVTRGVLARACAGLVLFPASHASSPLVEALEAEAKAPLAPLARRHFSEDAGLERLNALSAAKLEPRDLESRYLARAAAAALLFHVEVSQEATFCTRSLNVRLDDRVEGKLMMDAVTLLNLELLSNSKAPLRGKKPKEGCLLDLLDHAVTPPGHRALRAELASPPADVTLIKERQELIHELAEKAAVLEQIRELLRQLHDVDLLTSHYAVRPKAYTMQTLKREADNSLRLREVLRVLPQLAECLDRDLDSALAKTLATSLHSAEAAGATLLAEIDAVLTPASQFQRGVEEQRIEALFCVKPGVDGVLDIARESYHKTINAMKQFVAALNTSHQELHAELNFSARRGYHLRLPRRRKRRGQDNQEVQQQQQQVQTLPAVLIRRTVRKSKIDCTTETLESLNLKQEQAASEAFKRTEQQLGGVRDHVKPALVSLFGAADAAALLDVAQSLACFSAQPNLTMPRILDADQAQAEGLRVKQGRHLLVERALGGYGAFVANDLELAPHDSLRVVMGPNCCGKSTLLRQTALLVVLAQLGCSVPAEQAALPVFDRVLTRVGNEDSLEANASSFSLEMAETAFALQAESAPGLMQLVLVDELGRGTSTREGFALAWAVAEALRAKPAALTLFTTHLAGLDRLAGRAVYFTEQGRHRCEQQQAAAEAAAAVPEGYGLRLAEACGFPRRVMALSMTARARLRDNEAARRARQQRLRVLLRDAAIMTEQQAREALVALRDD